MMISHRLGRCPCLHQANRDSHRAPLCKPFISQSSSSERHARNRACMLAGFRHAWQPSNATAWGRTMLQACRARAKDLWAYPGTRVQEFNLETFRFMHKLSYGHRNRRTFVVVLYDPSMPACQNIEFEVERLASGLSHEPSVVVARLNVAAQGNKLSETSQFVGGVLGVQQLPTLLLYPEASPGVMRYQGKKLTAEAILDSLNRCYEQVLPHRPSMVLLGVPGPEDMFPQQTPSQDASTSAQAQVVLVEGSAAAGSTNVLHGSSSSSSSSSGGSSGQQGSSVDAEAGVGGAGSGEGDSTLLPPNVTSSMSGQQQQQQPSSSNISASSGNTSGQQQQQQPSSSNISASSGNTSGQQQQQQPSSSNISAGSGNTSGQQQQQQPNSSSSSSSAEMGQGWRKRRREGGRGEAGINAGADVWQPPRQSYWTGEKVLLWGGMLLLSVGAFVWERWLGPRAELLGLKKRQAARAAGLGDQFDEDTNLDDLWRLKTLRSTPEGAALLAKYVGDGEEATAVEAISKGTGKGKGKGVEGVQEAYGPGQAAKGGSLAGLNGANGVGLRDMQSGPHGRLGALGGMQQRQDSNGGHQNR